MLVTEPTSTVLGMRSAKDPTICHLGILRSESKDECGRRIVEQCAYHRSIKGPGAD